MLFKTSNHKFKLINIFTSNKFILLISILLIILTTLAIKFYIKHNYQFPCPQKYTIGYIWMHGQIPSKYQQFINRCGNNIKLITQKNYQIYLKQWNIDFPQYALKEKLRQKPLIYQIQMLKKLYLYYERGIYSDFDTQINEQCFDDVYTDKVIFTNMQYAYPLLPQQNFMMVRNQYNLQVKQWIIKHYYQLIHQGDRWQWCRQNRCLIIKCQQHLYDNSWK